MAREIKKTNPNLIALIRNLRKQSYEEEVGIWKEVAIKLEKPARNPLLKEKLWLFQVKYYLTVN